MNFSEFCLLQEALKIIKKADKSKLLDKPFDDTFEIGKVGKYNVVKTRHISHIRDYENDRRDVGITKSRLLEIIKKFIDKETPKEKVYYHIIYKEKDKYNDLIVTLNNTDIMLITVIQGFRDNPTDYFLKKKDIRVIIEKMNYEQIIIEIN